MEHLLKPEIVKKADYVFQYAVSVLLSLLGYSVIVLGKGAGGIFPDGKYERIRFESGYEFGSVDLLAYKDNNKLFLVECTTGAVDDPKITILQQTVHYISSKEDRTYSKIMGLICSPRECAHRKHYYEDIHILDKSRLEKILNLMLDGKTDDAIRNLFI